MDAHTHRPGFDRPMTKAEINAVPLTRYTGPIKVISHPDQCPAACAGLQDETTLGFDTETQPTFVKGAWHPPALIQLATSRKVLIFQLGSVGLPAPLRQLLEDPAITKAGVAPERDLQDLQHIAPFTPAGFIDLGILARQRGIQNFGLRGLAAVVLGRRISKQARVSNWAAPRLQPAQITYAATDAWISRELYLRLRKLPTAP